MPEMVIIMGPPASGKSTIVAQYPKHIRLNRDILGGKTIDLLPRMIAHLRDGDNVVLDNLFTKASDRKPFIDAAKALGTTPTCVYMDTSIEDCQINVLHRMQTNHGRLFMTAEDMKTMPTKDPGVFPIVVLFKWRQDFERPTTDEGFAAIKKIPFVRKWDPIYKNKAIILDYDDTLRTVKNGEYKYPTSPDQVEILPGRTEALKTAIAQGYMLCGASNQSGIAKGILDKATAEACFVKTNHLLGVGIDYAYCPHSVPPIMCWCRKPGCALLMKHVEFYKLDPAQCIFVGDSTSDKTCATRMGMQYQTPKQFFGQ